VVSDYILNENIIIIITKTITVAEEIKNITFQAYVHIQHRSRHLSRSATECAANKLIAYTKD